MAGDANTLYLPKSFRAGHAELRLLVTALGAHAEVSEISVESVL
jgi:hypothetical protein